MGASYNDAFADDARTYLGQVVSMCKEAFDAGKIAPAAPNKFGKMQNGNLYVFTINPDRRMIVIFPARLPKTAASS